MTPTQLHGEFIQSQHYKAGQCRGTLFAVVDDVLAEQVVVAEHHGRAQCGEMLLHPEHLLLQQLLAWHFLLDSTLMRRRTT